MKKIISAVSLILFLASCAHLIRSRNPSSIGNPVQDLSTQQRDVYDKLLTDSLLFFDRALRDPASGQYYDAISLDNGGQGEDTSSVAATGMGLMGLALGDATGVIPDAHDQAVQSLRFVLGQGHVNGRPYATHRSKDGWFRHWFNIYNGQDNDGSTADGYSTIDTAILAAGAQFAANYFSANGKDPDRQIRKLADQLLYSVNWPSAIADADEGKLYMNYDLDTERPRSETSKFNEYILVACLGHYAELRRGDNGPMSAFWKRNYGSPQNLPQKAYDGKELLTDYPGHYLSSFVTQFATYLCSDVSTNPTYLSYLKAAQKADREWFEDKTQQTTLWGLGAGEVDYLDPSTHRIKAGYHADSIGDNPHMIASPHIIAGYIPVYPQGLNDLITMYRQNMCKYTYHGLDFLWRCSLSNLKLKIRRVQAIDFSSMFLGLASADPEVGGLNFYAQYAAGAASLSARTADASSHP